jgi:hypothetical protein
MPLHPFFIWSINSHHRERPLVLLCEKHEDKSLLVLWQHGTVIRSPHIPQAIPSDDLLEPGTGGSRLPLYQNTKCSKVLEHSDDNVVPIVRNDFCL